MPIHGTGIKNQNVRLRMLLIIFVGILAFGAVMYWRTTLLDPDRYLTTSRYTERVNGDLRSSNYQIEVQESSPAVE